jgi:hypothetical protein
MNLNFNVTGDRRKALVKAISEYLGIEAIYNGAPNFSYTVGTYTIDKNGTVTGPDNRELMDALAEPHGFVSLIGAFDDEPDDNAEPDADDSDTLTVDMPLAGFDERVTKNLIEIIASKDRLIRKALAADDLQVYVDVAAGKIHFPWFTLTGTDGEIDAYIRFVTALCKMAKTQKRVTAKERNLDNDKFTMRLFLVRLGFVGPEHKVARQILLRNLTGNTAWKSGQPPAKEGADNPDAKAPADKNEGGSTL